MPDDFEYDVRCIVHVLCIMFHGNSNTMLKYLILHLIPLKVKTKIVHRFVSRIVVLGPMFHNDLTVYLVIRNLN